jgi:hypothetical protein
MNITDFNTYWHLNYPESFPTNYELKWIYEDRWIRIHSLPDSKRYADTEAEYDTIFERQNQLINDLIGEGSEIIITFGLYTGDISINNYKKLTDFGEFNKVQTIDLKKERPEEHEDDLLLDIYIKIENWRSNSKNDILRAIADDEIRAMFICPSKNCIVAPYDGGVDIIVDSSKKRDELKVQYRDWLSDREDGL